MIWRPALWVELGKDGGQEVISRSSIDESGSWHDDQL
jgi:hypothetical protein